MRHFVSQISTSSSPIDAMFLVCTISLLSSATSSGPTDDVFIIDIRFTTGAIFIALGLRPRGTRGTTGALTAYVVPLSMLVVACPRDAPGTTNIVRSCPTTSGIVTNLCHIVLVPLLVLASTTTTREFINIISNLVFPAASDYFHIAGAGSACRTGVVHLAAVLDLVAAADTMYVLPVFLAQPAMGAITTCPIHIVPVDGVLAASLPMLVGLTIGASTTSSPNVLPVLDVLNAGSASVRTRFDVVPILVGQLFPSGIGASLTSPTHALVAIDRPVSWNIRVHGIARGVEDVDDDAMVVDDPDHLMADDTTQHSVYTADDAMDIDEDL